MVNKSKAIYDLIIIFITGKNDKNLNCANISNQKKKRRKNISYQKKWLDFIKNLVNTNAFSCTLYFFQNFNRSNVTHSSLVPIKNDSKNVAMFILFT